VCIKAKVLKLSSPLLPVFADVFEMAYLRYCMQAIGSYEVTKAKILDIRVSAWLSLFHLDCSQLNIELARNAQLVRDQVVLFVGNQHRANTKEYVHAIDRLFDNLFIG